MSKDEILDLYLNRIYFGGGAYGVEAAAQTYFGKSATALTLSEAALLAALPKAPTHLAPTNDFAAALARSHQVLAAMLRAGWITPAQKADAEAHPPKLSLETRTEGDFGYVLDLAAQEAQRANPNNVPDLVVRLTVDPRLQAAGDRGGAGRGGPRRAPRRLAGGPGGPGARRRGAGSGGRGGSPPLPLRPGDPGASPAGLGLQALRLRRRPGERAEARRRPPRRPDQGRKLAADQCGRNLRRQRHPLRGPGPLHQHRGGAGQPGGGRGQGGGTGPPLWPGEHPAPSRPAR